MANGNNNNTGNNNGNGNITWRLIGGALATVLIGVLAWFSAYMIGKVDALDDRLRTQALAIGGLSNLFNSQNERYIEIIRRLDREVDHLSEEVDEMTRADREVLRQEIRTALASRGIGMPKER